MFRYRYYYFASRRRHDGKITNIIMVMHLFPSGMGGFYSWDSVVAVTPRAQSWRPSKLFRKLNRKRTKTTNLNSVRSICDDGPPRLRCVGVREYRTKFQTDDIFALSVGGFLLVALPGTFSTAFYKIITSGTLLWIVYGPLENIEIRFIILTRPGRI